MYDWVKLTSQMGDTISDPTDEDLTNILIQLFQNHDEEHPDAWIECGVENGPLFTLIINFHGDGKYTKYEDCDMEKELISKSISGLDEKKSLDLWKALINGEMPNI